MKTISDFCEMMMDEHLITQQKWKDIADGAEAKRLLNKFYEALQKNIDGYKYKSDRAGWTIKFDEAVAWRNFTFYGVDSNLQTWFLNMKMNQTTTNEYGSVAGNYEGYFNITAEHEMDRFESNVHLAIKNMGTFGDAIKKMESNSELKLQTRPGGSAYISRTISGTCEATIEESGNIQFSMDIQNDEIQVVFSGLIVDASYTLGGRGEGKFSYEISNKGEDIIVKAGTSTATIIAPDFNNTNTKSSSKSIEIEWDEEIWKHWDGTEKTLKHAE